MEISHSLVKLQRLSASFEGLSNGQPTNRAEKRTMLRLVGQLGAVAVPTCIRRLASESEDRAHWAYALLAQLGENDSVKGRVVSELTHLVGDPGMRDSTKMLALALLTELGAEVPVDPNLRNPGAARDQSLKELAGYLTTRADIARAADVLIDQLDEEDLLGFLDDVSSADPRSARTLASEMLLRDDLSSATHRRLVSLRGGLPSLNAVLKRQRRRQVELLLGSHQDGRSVVLAWQRRPGSKPPRWRALCALLGESGKLSAADHVDDLTLGAVKREVQKPLVIEGFSMEELSFDEGRRIVLEAAHSTSSLGEHLPKGFYLGRDLLEIESEHLVATDLESEDSISLFNRGIDLMAAGSYQEARPLLMQFVTRRPEDPEGAANLGLCLLHLGDSRAARQHLARAAWLAPTHAIHHWNLASAAHLEGRRGRCYLALRDYLALEDDDLGASERGDVARQFVAEFERHAQLQFPDLAPAEFARASLQNDFAPARFEPREGQKHSRPL